MKIPCKYIYRKLNRVLWIQMSLLLNLFSLVITFFCLLALSKKQDVNNKLFAYSRKKHRNGHQIFLNREIKGRADGTLKDYT